MREYCVDETDCFMGAADKATFLTQHERSVIVKALIDNMRAIGGPLKLTLESDEVFESGGCFKERLLPAQMITTKDEEEVVPIEAISIEIREGQAIGEVQKERD